MSTHQANGIKIEVLKGDITIQPQITAIVNAANAHLRPGGGVAGAIHRVAGPELARECQSDAPISPGEVILTGGHGLPNDYVLHCLGPRYGTDTPEDKLLADCYRNTLQLAEEHDIDSIAFPAISTGAFGYPIEEATEVALDTVLDQIPNLDSIETIRFVLYSAPDRDIYDEKLKRRLESEN